MQINQSYIKDLMVESGIRADEATTAVLTRQLEAVISKTFDIEYSILKARQFIPFNSSLNDGAETWLYRTWDMAGIAKVIANYADDAPLVDLAVSETPMKMLDLGDSYMWSIKDLKRAALMNMPLQERKARAAREGIERKIDEIAAVGVPSAGLEGFANHSNIPQVSATAAWSGATAAQILDDLFRTERAVIDNTKDNHEPDAFVLPSSDYGKVMTTPYSANSDKTIGQYFLANAQSVRNIGRWNKLETADAGSARGVCYKRSPDVLEFMIPNEFEQMPPEKRNYAWLVDCLATVGGTAWYRPLAAAYLDGI